MKNETVIPLFPLGLVLLPGMHLPLHIFEQRYRLMTRECIEEEKEFGVVLFDGKRIRDFGCTAEIVKVLKEYPDGRSDIFTVGKKRFFIRKILDEKPYLEARAAFFDDDVEERTHEWELFAAKGVSLLMQTESVPPEEQSRGLLKNRDFKGISFLIAGSEGFSPEEQQGFLEMTSTFDRLKKGSESLEKIIERNILTQEIQTLIGGNGNIRKYFKDS